jgi:hypothetical protein
MMDLAAIERALAASRARPLLVDARLVRRVIKQHRRLAGGGLAVPHARCFALPRGELLAIATPAELGHAAADIPEQVILLPRPEAHETAGKSLPQVLGNLWRYAFHAAVHLEVERLIASGVLTPARIRERIHRIGQTEFDEIRIVLRQDSHLLPPHDDRETYVEFAALYLELQSFAPGLVREVFPTLADPGAADAALASDIDAGRLLEATRPEGAEMPHEERAGEAAPAADEDQDTPAPAGGREALIHEADAARAAGNAVRSALLRVRAGAVIEARADAEALAGRLDAALRPADAAAESKGVDRAAWTAALLELARHAVARKGLFRRVEARLLYDVQGACLAGERPVGKVDLVGWALALGQRPLAPLLPATREIRVARRLERAARKVARVGLPEGSRARLRRLLAAARGRADESLREELRPVVLGALVEVGLKPDNVPERVALGKLVDELLDQATAHGHLSLGHLRDAVSRNQLKLPDLAGPRELLGADPLLAADRRLARAVDGVHRRGELYLRVLQKCSSLLFGTRVGRAITFYVILPFGGGFALPFATEVVATELEHLGHGLLRLVHVLPPEPPLVLPIPTPLPFDLPIAVAARDASIESLLPHLEHHLTHKPFGELLHAYWASSRPLIAACAILLFGLIHSAGVRAAALGVLRAVGFVLRGIFFDVPRWILSQPLVRRVLESRAFVALRRFLIKPGIAGAAALWGMERHPDTAPLALPVAGAVFVVTGVALGTRAGMLAEEIVTDAVGRSYRKLERDVVPGLFRLVAGFFRQVTDLVDRALYAVDEWLQFQRGQRSGALVLKGVLGIFWFAFAYVLRVFVNLFLEPTVNPLKHFPTVTVAAKVMWASLPNVLQGALEPLLGPLRAGTITGFAMAILPGFFGFLVWELKENYKLYRATRPAMLRPVPIGHHGETMSALMKPGLHSGTLPKLWAKLRRAAKKGDPSVEKHHVAMRELMEAVERFADRELVALLAASDHWKGGAVHVAHVALGSNRVRVELARDGQAEPCTIAFEEQSGWLVAGVARPGWAAALDGDQRVIFENALAGLYERAGVDLVREQIEAALPPGTPYDIADEGLVVWPEGFATERVYDLQGRGTLTATVRGEPAAGEAPPPPIERSAIVFHEQGIAWKDWVAAWSGEPARVVKGTSLLRVPPTPRTGQGSPR